MTGVRREDRKATRLADPKEEEPLLRFMKGYASFRNRNVFFFMVLSVIPAAICQAFYMQLNVLHIEGRIYTFFFTFDYTKYVSPNYDFIIQPLVVLLMMNLGLIGIKFIGWGLKDGEKEEESLISKYKNFIFSGLMVLCFAILLYYNAPMIAWAFPAILILFYLLALTRSKTVIFFTLLVLNIVLFTTYFRYFQINVPINGNPDTILTFMAKVGYSWLYILPYNFFIFFPLVIGIYFFNFRYPEKYISSFFDVVFHENIVAVFMGLLLNILLSVVPLFIIISQPEIHVAEPGGLIERVIYTIHRILAQEEAVTLKTFEMIAIFHFWIGSFILWFTPFLVSLAQLEARFEANFDRILRDTIQRMKNHVVVIGFGNLGKKVCSDLVERGVISSTKDTEEILTPDLEVRKICKRLLVIDSNDGLFDRVHIDPILQNVGVGRSRIDVEGKREDILIPAIIGDINSETTKESSRLKDSKFFVSASSDYKATFTLSKFANRKDLDSIISVEDSAQKDYFSPKLTAHDAFLIYPAFEEGVVLGRTTSLCYFRLREEKKRDLRIVIAGEGKQIHYILETFWMEMQKAGVNLDSTRPGTFSLPISILTESKEIKKRSLMRRGRGTKKMREIEEIVKRSACRAHDDLYMLTDVILDSPDRLKTIEDIINDKEPDIVVITSKTTEKVSKIFYDWIVGIERHICVRNEDYKPVVIVGILGDEYEEIQDILLYYSAIEPKSRNRFPIQYLDAAVRVYDDLKDQIGGLAQALAREGPMKHKKRKTGVIDDPFALYCCLRDVPGSLGNLLGKLAGIKFKNNSTPNIDPISLHFCRFQNCSGVENYSFLANAELQPKEEMTEKENLLSCLFQSESGDLSERESRRNKMAKLLGIENADIPQLEDIYPFCDQRTICAIGSYLRKVKNLKENREYYAYLEDVKELLRKGTVDYELKRFYINPDFGCPQMDRSQEESDFPKAALLVCCRHPNITGSLSAAVNNLLFRKIEEIYEEDVVDITYLRSYECYNSALTNIEFYGNFVHTRNNERELLKKKGSIDLVFINPVTRKDLWLEYARQLCGMLNSTYDKPYGLWVDSRDDKDNIAIIREEFKEEVAGSLCVKCKKEECMIPDKVRLLKEKLI